MSLKVAMDSTNDEMWTVCRAGIAIISVGTSAAISLVLRSSSVREWRGARIVVVADSSSHLQDQLHGFSLTVKNQARQYLLEALEGICRHMLKERSDELVY